MKFTFIQFSHSNTQCYWGSCRYIVNLNKYLQLLGYNTNFQYIQTSPVVYNVNMKLLNPIIICEFQDINKALYKKIKKYKPNAKIGLIIHAHSSLKTSLTNYADFLIINGPLLFQQFQKKFWDINKKINKPYFIFRAPSPFVKPTISNHIPQYIMIPSNQIRKGIELFIKIAAHIKSFFPKFKFGCIKAFVGQRKIPDKSICDTFEPTDFSKILSRTAILLHTSFQEGSGYAWAEAGSVGIPVVANKTDCVNILQIEKWGEIINDRENINEWTEKIFKVLANYNKYSQQAKKHFENMEKISLEDTKKFVNWLKTF